MQNKIHGARIFHNHYKINVSCVANGAGVVDGRGVITRFACGAGQGRSKAA
jgi:hypothetical protein